MVKLSDFYKANKEKIKLSKSGFYKFIYRHNKELREKNLITIRATLQKRYIYIVDEEKMMQFINKVASYTLNEEPICYYV